MASDDFSIKTKITLDTKNYEAGIKKAESATQKFSSSLSGVTKLLKSTFAIAGISVGTKAIINFGKETVKYAEDANKALKILDNTVKVTGADTWTTTKELVGMSEEIAHTTNYTVGEIQDMQSVLLGFKNITGETFREASDAITDMATVMGMDLKSAVQTVGKALDDPIKGLDSLRRQGFAFTEEQKEELKQLVENGEQLKAQKIILDELNTTYGGAAKSAQSSFDKQRDAVISFKETLGNQLIPVLDVFAEKSATSFSTLTEKIKTIDFSEIAGTVEYSVQVITEYFGVFYNNAKELVKGLTERFGDIEISLDTVKEAVYNSLNNIYKQMQISFGFVKALIDGDWKLAWEYAKIYVLNVCKKILDGLDDLLKKMPDLVNGAIKGLNAYYEAQDKVLLEWFHLPEKWFKAPRLGTYDGKNFIDTSELQKQIDEATRIIEKATGKQVTINLTGLEKIEENKKKYQKKAEAGEIQLTKTVIVEEKKRVKESETIFSSFLDNLKKQIADKTEFYNGLFSKVTETFSTMFSMLGENLVGAGHSFEDFASVALNALSEVLKSISAQLSAIAVLKVVSKDYADAAIALAGATASMVASGVASQVSKNLTTTKEKIDAIGESANKAGKDLEYFKKRLEEITSGMTSSSRNLIANITELKQGWKEAKETADEAYETYDKARKELENNEKYQRYLELGRATGNYTLANMMAKPVEELGKKYQELSKQVDEYYKEYREASKNVLADIKAEVAGNETLIQSYKDIYQSLHQYQIASVRWGLLTFWEKAIDILGFGNGLYEQLEQYKTYVNILLNEQKVSVQKLLTDVYDQLSNTGKNIGDKLVNSIINGAEKADFLGEMKSYIRENLIKIAVYTESFQDELAEVGMKLASALTEGTSELGAYDMQEVRGELEKLYESATENAKKAEAIIELTFGDVQKKIEDEVVTTVNNVKIEINAIGEEIGNTIFSSILEGAERSDFLVEMKNFMRENLLKLAIYTDEFNKQLKEIGERISNALIGDMTEDVVSGLRSEIETLYDSAIRNAERAESLVNSVFGDIQETVEETTETIEESIEVVEETLTSFEELMKSFNEEVADVGGDIGSTFVDAISNGMNQSDFLGKMKDWIKRMLVQSVVYTESMKSEIEAIGQAITKGIREGFTETSLHEIRRDLSWVFNEANETVASLDNILDRTFGGYATGTNNALSGLHLVGEAGPELIRFRGGEQVLNAGNTQKALEGMGGTTINQNVTFNNLQDTTAYAMMNQFKQYNRSLAINGII